MTDISVNTSLRGDKVNLNENGLIGEKSYEEIFNQLVKFAEACDKISAMVLFGSRARSEKKADHYSDYDILFFVSDVDYFLKDDEWLESISKPYISFVERTAVQDYERRVFFDNAMDMDFIFYNVQDIERITAHPIIKSWYARGYQIVVDKISYKELVEENKPFKLKTADLTEEKFNNLIQTFWFHSIWATKKLLRGEIWASKNCIDGYMKNLLREILEYQAKALNGASFDIWHDGRFFDQRISEAVILDLNNAYGQYDKASLEVALKRTMALFAREAQKVAQLLHYSYPIEAEEYAIKQVTILLDKVWLG